MSISQQSGAFQRPELVESRLVCAVSVPELQHGDRQLVTVGQVALVRRPQRFVVLVAVTTFARVQTRSYEYNILNFLLCKHVLVKKLIIKRLTQASTM